MPHYKCVGCKTRLYRAAARADLVGDLCPGCGALLEPVGELAEIVGFQSIERRTSSADDRLPSRHRQLANRVNDLFARRAGDALPEAARGGRYSQTGDE